MYNFPNATFYITHKIMVHLFLKFIYYIYIYLLYLYTKIYNTFFKEEKKWELSVPAAPRAVRYKGAAPI